MYHFCYGLLLAAIAGLGSSRYQERDQCQRLLTHFTATVADDLTAAADDHPDAEVRRRCQQLLDLHFQQTAKTKSATTLPKGWPRLPWVDMLPDSDEFCGVSQHYLELARKVTGEKGPPDWEDYRYATRLLLEDLYASRRTALTVPRLLELMRDRERDWIREHGGRYNPPIELPLSPEF